MQKKQIKGNMANILTYMGNLYRNPPDAIKEYVSNFIDEWRKYPEISRCDVVFDVSPDKIVISGNIPGMDQDEFENALIRVADSAKQKLDIPQIGELGIGLFAFNQIGSRCQIFSKKRKGTPTVKVKLQRKSDTYEIDIAKKSESLNNPGMKIEIIGLFQDPTNSRTSLSVEKLARHLSEKFDSYLRKNVLRITILKNNAITSVEPLELNLPAIGLAYKEIRLKKNSSRTIGCNFWFDPEGSGIVSIRHKGIPIVEDIRSIFKTKGNVFTEGYVKGYIDADFLTPLPSRTSFQENNDFAYVLWELELISSSIETEVLSLISQEERKIMSEAELKAIEISKEILSGNDFKSLELITGMVKGQTHSGKEGEGTNPDKRSCKGTITEGSKKDKRGFRMGIELSPFASEPNRHSRHQDGVIKVNSLNSNFIYEMNRSKLRQIQFFADIIGKENIAFNDKKGDLDEYLEKLLNFNFQVRRLLDKKNNNKS